MWHYFAQQYFNNVIQVDNMWQPLLKNNSWHNIIAIFECIDPENIDIYILSILFAEIWDIKN